MFQQLEAINARPAPFAHYTADALWTDPYRAARMLEFHLNEAFDVSSRKPDFIARATAWIGAQFQLGPGKSVCDFGCGPGLYTARLAATGAAVTGLDFSANSIAYARARAKEAGQAIRYEQVDYLTYRPTQRFDLITMIMCDFCALSPAQRQQLLGIFDQALAPGGALLLDVYSLAGFAEQKEAQLYEKNQLGQFWFAEPYYAFVNHFKYEAEGVMLDKYSLFPATGAPQTVYNWLQYFSPDGLAAELAQAGFAVEACFGDVAGAAFEAAAPEFAVLARKAAP